MMTNDSGGRVMERLASADLFMLMGAPGVLQYIGYTGMCRWKGYGFQAIYSGIGSSNHRKMV